MATSAFEIELGYYKGPLEPVLAGLEDARLEGAILELDGDSEELVAFVEEPTGDRPDLADGDNTIWVSRRLPAHAVEALRAALGDGLRPPRS